MALNLLFRRYSPQARISFTSFTLSSLLAVILFLLSRFLPLNWSNNNLIEQWSYINVAIFILINLLTIFRYHSDVAFYGITWRSCLLGSAFGSSFVALLLVSYVWRSLMIFFMIVSFFHFSEFFFTALSKPRSLGLDLFLLNHSPAYNFALVIAVIEYVIEVKWFPHLKLYHSLSMLGLLICIVGESIRKTAILTAKSNFDHRLKTYKDKDHVLVTHGIYSWSRHPAYVGWFYWAIGTQIVLLNPFSLIFYAISSWKFFDDRVDFEESLLLRFFGQEYRSYQNKVPTRLPFIRGCYYE